MLRLAGPGDFASLCAIWRAGFGDGEEYVRLFWQNWRESCRPYLWQDEAGPAAALFLLPVEYRRGGERVPLWYLYAAATLPQRQGEGIMSRMLEEVYRRETGGRLQNAVNCAARSGHRSGEAVWKNKSICCSISAEHR